MERTPVNKRGKGPHPPPPQLPLRPHRAPPLRFPSRIPLHPLALLPPHQIRILNVGIAGRQGIYCERMPRAEADTLLPVWQTQRYRENVSRICGKRGGESIKQAPATPEISGRAHTTHEGREASSLSYTVFNSLNLLEL